MKSHLFKSIIMSQQLQFPPKRLFQLTVLSSEGFKDDGVVDGVGGYGLNPNYTSQLSMILVKVHPIGLFLFVVFVGFMPLSNWKDDQCQTKQSTLFDLFTWELQTRSFESPTFTYFQFQFVLLLCLFTSFPCHAISRKHFIEIT